MAAVFDTVELNSCLLRCLKIMYDLISIPQLSTLQSNVKDFLSAVLYILRAIDREPAVLDNISVERRDGARRVFKNCATCLEELDSVCYLFKECSIHGWKLDDDETGRALFIDLETSPISDIGGILSYLGYTLPGWLEDGLINQKQVGTWDDWAKSMADNMDEFQLRIDIARELARINLSTTSLQQNLTPVTTALPADALNSSHDGGIETAPYHGDNQVWARIGEDLAAEGVFGATIERIEDRLKDCVRRLARGRIPHWKPSDYSAADGTRTSTNGESVDEPVTLSQAVEVVGRLRPEIYDSVAPGIFKIAVRSVKAFRKVLGALYDSACRDPDRAAVHARLAKSLQTRSTGKIRKRMPSSRTVWNGETRTEKGPVTSYLWNRCWTDWNNGKHGRLQISAQNFALGLSSFIGQLVKHKMFYIYHAHILLDRLLQPAPPVGRVQFVALYHLLRTVGCIIEGSTRISEEMSAHFERIDAIIDSNDVAYDIFVLGMGVRGMRLRGWKAEKRRDGSAALERVLESFKNGQ